MDMLAITNLQKRFGDKSVLKGVDLSVPEHSVFGFIGKNGAGKTTTMKTILGLLKADGGEILVSGEKVVYGQTATNRHIGYTLSPEKQQAIINAGYRVFSQNSYKNSPMSEIAAEAGISKSLLFHYFHNKKELYLFLWDKCAETTIEFLTRYGCYGQTELFESMERGMRAKMEIIRLYPDMGNFTIKAFYEKDAGISAAIQESYHRYFNLKADKTRLNLDPSQFIPGLDIPMMYREMYWASEGYLWEMVQQGNVDIEKMEKDFTKLLAFWKSIYLRKE